MSTISTHDTATHRVAVIGAGLAGSEAALVLARNAVAVDLYEMRPAVMTPAHRTGSAAELVCSNSLKSDLLPGAHGLLKKELMLLGSPLLHAAYRARVPAGTALAVDRAIFSTAVDEAVRSSDHIRVIGKEAVEPPPGVTACIIAAGPLVSDSLSTWMRENLGGDALHFYDAIAPVIARDSLDQQKVFAASRYDRGDGEYLNCPFTQEEYHRFFEALTGADRVTPRPFEEERFFEACLPIEIIAKRGFDALRFGPMKPVGLRDPRTGRRPYAVLQLRPENRTGRSYGMVGFQTRLKQGDQRRVFRMIPGLEQAEFERLGAIHRNTYLDAPRILAPDLSVRSRPGTYIAGQLCGNEGYTESIATGHLAALFVLGRLGDMPLPPPPPTTALGSLLRGITASTASAFAPVNIRFGLFDPLEETGTGRVPKRVRKERMAERALTRMESWITAHRNGHYFATPTVPRYLRDSSV